MGVRRRVDIAAAVAILSAGGVVALPTETVYGLAAVATNETAIRSVYAIKQRPLGHPLIVHGSSMTALEGFVDGFDDFDGMDNWARKLADHFWPGPLTLLVKPSSKVSTLVMGDAPRVATRVAIRVPAHAMTLAVLDKLGEPVVAPSANAFGLLSPTCAEHVGLDVPILDGGACERGIESTIVGKDAGNVVVYRLGAIGREQIAAVLGKEVGISKQTSKQTGGVPGGLSKHYAPTKPLVVCAEEELEGYLRTDGADRADRAGRADRVGLLRYSTWYAGVPRNRQFVLSATGDLAEAGRRFFQGLHVLSACNGVEYIVAEPLPDRGLGCSLNDRLKRGSYA